MSLGTRLFTLLHGRLVGTDGHGNRYYSKKGDDHDATRPARRWVLYAGPAEATAVPPEWHAWLHRITDRPPSEAPLPTKPWEKEHRPNPTGTPDADLPSGHLLGAGRRAKATGDYEAWRP
ncbi:MAG: NADH:ubiquinone oxidoreductase subunit NDUFA12 [Alphaproteobacteria bacterium]